MLRRAVSSYSRILLNQSKGKNLLLSNLRSKQCQRHFTAPQLLIQQNWSFYYFDIVGRLHTSQSYHADIIEVEGPAFAESISEGDIRWMKQKGDFVNRDDLVAEIETDKTTVEVPASQSGTIVELLVKDGDRVTAHQKLYKLEIGGEAPAKAVEETRKPVEQETVRAPPPKSGSVQPESPEKPVIPASPVKIATQPFPSSVPSQSELEPSVEKVPSATDQTLFTGSRNETRVKMNRMRLRIAQRLKDAQNTYAMLTTFNEVDMSSILEMRKRYQKEFIAKYGIKIGLMSPFIRASAYALQEFPTVNAVIDEGDILYRHYIDVSVAVATPKGLVVPVLRNVETMDYAAIEKTLSEYAIKFTGFHVCFYARDGKLAIEDMEGGTFTISNGGVFGSVSGTPIINPPQSAILGMHGIFDRPVAIDGKVEIRPMMNIALTYDHRLIDGREAVTFCERLRFQLKIHEPFC
ncbi:Dihydrolipoyllysine-residue succinyltransferase component of 2-oxoglutarate dehydrogenase complex, mitochondrial [Dirofilaria immitis]|nr:Dihydrolipoyllysine-residue succinyltransferase component of 2-oxoglutarate dehydrogenase complex, mitochondrial [Dirofilaria immitis]